MRTPQRSRGQARITVGVGPRHYTIAGPSVSHLSPNYTENKYVKRVSIFFFFFVFESGQIQSGHCVKLMF